jgi:hypothetical protein
MPHTNCMRSRDHPAAFVLTKGKARDQIFRLSSYSRSRKGYVTRNRQRRRGKFMNARGIAFISQRNGSVGEHKPPRIQRLVLGNRRLMDNDFGPSAPYPKKQVLRPVTQNWGLQALVSKECDCVATSHTLRVFHGFSRV